MKKSEVPQDKSTLENFSREVCYAKDDDGSYNTALSTGWSVKAEALENAWEEIDRLKEEARKEVAAELKSPIYYFMQLKLMDVALLAAYTGFWKITVRRHFKPSVFEKLNQKRLAIYAGVFEISVQELKNFKG
ncbi:hypothetical protein [uncultured Acetobacteroides sp.]|uniref:hypothetical protein n=1 Tax=uncultured Acetobacteroides sp. TaxID=1760811 RepID=UPI0029F58AFB|nr:hypothetical protein [uncultured Acetobacteroides sp.]